MGNDRSHESQHNGRDTILCDAQRQVTLDLKHRPGLTLNAQDMQDIMPFLVICNY